MRSRNRHVFSTIQRWRVVITWWRRRCVRASPVFAVGAFRTALLASPEVVAAEFSKYRAIACASAIEPDLLASLIRLCREGHFEPNEVKDLGHREVESPQRAGRTLTHVLKR